MKNGTMRRIDGREFSRLLHQKHSSFTKLRDIFEVEGELGVGAVRFQLNKKGQTLLLRALDAERKLKLIKAQRDR